MRKILRFSVCICIAATTSCTDNAQKDSASLVAEIYDYNNELLAKYTYDDQNRLIKRSYTHPVTKASSEWIFHYDGFRVRAIESIDHTTPDLSGEKRFYYDEEGRVVKVETRTGEALTGTFELNYSPEGRVISTNVPGEEPATLYEYDHRGNVIKTTGRYENPSTGQLFESVSGYTYDTNSKANFGIDFLPGVELLPKRGTKSNWEQSLSQNNLLSEGYAEKKMLTYEIEYDENRRPKTITTRWKGMETQTPATLRIVNRER